MSRRLALVATLVALSVAGCAPAEPPLLIDETNAPATLAGDEAPSRVNLAAGSPPRSSNQDATPSR